MEQARIHPLEKTPLYNRHVSLGAKMAPFASWEMPIFYTGIIQEHKAVRTSVGIFDVCHMGHIVVIGAKAEEFLNWLLPVEVTTKKVGSAFYSLMCSSAGGVVDDVIVMKETENRFHIIVNASNRLKDLEHIKKASTPFDVQIIDHFQEDGILALQGPKALHVMEKIFPASAELKPMQMKLMPYRKQTVILSRTGYTGSGGYEIIAPLDLIESLWDALLEEGKEDIQPIGLGARDTLRLEMGYALYGHELSEEIYPQESVAAWTLNLTKPNYLGKEAIDKLENPRYALGIILEEQGIPRERCPIFFEGTEVGKVTSGTFSPMLEKGIALVLVNKPLSFEDPVEVFIRNHKLKAKVVPLPFWHKQT